MRKLILALVLFAACAWGSEPMLAIGNGTPDVALGLNDFYVTGTVEGDGAARFDGNVTLGDAAGDVITITGTMAMTAPVSFPDGTVLLPSFTFTSDPDTGIYWIGANSFGVTVGGVNVLTWDGTGTTSTGFNGPIGTVTPAQGEFTNIYGDGEFYYGQGFDDLHSGYRPTETIKFIETFDVGNDADLVVRWDTTNVVGLGTNDETTTDGWNTLTTGGAGGPDSESTRSWGLNHYRAYAPRCECVVDVGTLAGSEFNFGYWAAANQYVEITYDASNDTNWHLEVDDTAGAEDIDSGIAVTTDPTKLEIRVSAAGVITWAVDDVECTTVGLTNNMTANAHYLRCYGAEEGAAARVFAIDYIETEQLKQQ